MVSNKALQVLIDFIIFQSLLWLHVSVSFCYFFNSIFSSSRGKKADIVLPFLCMESPSCQRFSGVGEGHWHST